LSNAKIAGLALWIAVAGGGLGCDRAHDSGPGTADGLAEIRALVREPASIQSAAKLAERLTQLGPEVAPGIGRLIVHPGETLDPPRALLLLQFWIDRDAKSAAEWAVRSAPLAYRGLMLDPAVEKLATTDPKLAMRYVGAGGGADPRTIKPFVRGWVYSRQPGVEDWIRDLGYGFKRQKALGAFARALIQRDGAPAAIAWYEALPASEDGFQEDAFRRLAGELTYADPAQGVAWYEKHRAGPYGRGLLTVVSNAWIGVDGPAAMRWLSQQPASPDRDDAVVDAVRTWGVADLAGLKEWGRAEGAKEIAPWFQPGLPIFARVLGGDDPREGLHWAEQIRDDARRELTLIQIAREWRTDDRDAAEAWLAQSPLSEEARERARQVSTPRGPKPAAAAPAP
jgi:hypothetical protein